MHVNTRDRFRSAKRRVSYATIYAIGAVAFGLCFPIFTVPLQTTIDHGFISSQALATTFLGNPLLWAISTAPLFLGLLARLAGTRHDRLDVVLALHYFLQALVTFAADRSEPNLDGYERARQRLLQEIYPGSFTFADTY